MTIKEEVIELLLETGKHDSRCPYTNHHDYVRTHSSRAIHIGLSRSHIATLPADDEALWSCCFLHLASQYQFNNPDLFGRCCAKAKIHIKEIDDYLKRGVW